MKERNAAIWRSVEAAGEEKRLYSDFIVKFAGLIDRHRESVTREAATVGRWLFPPDPSINHNIARKAHHEGTASWFYQGGVFGDWKSSSSLLWVNGKRSSLFRLCYSTSH